MAAKKKITKKKTAKKKAARKKAASRRQPVEQTAGSYQHDKQAVQRPDVGLQGEFSGVREPKRYRYDSSLDPQLSWDENREREKAEWLLGLIERAANEGEAKVFAEPQVWQGDSTRVENLAGAAKLLQTLSKPFLNWSGKAERHEISVPTLPLFVHERHSRLQAKILNCLATSQRTLQTGWMPTNTKAPGPTA